MYIKTIGAMLACNSEMRTASPRLPAGQARIYFYRSGSPAAL